MEFGNWQNRRCRRINYGNTKLFAKVTSDSVPVLQIGSARNLSPPRPKDLKRDPQAAQMWTIHVKLDLYLVLLKCSVSTLRIRLGSPPEKPVFSRFSEAGSANSCQKPDGRDRALLKRLLVHFAKSN